MDSDSAFDDHEMPDWLLLQILLRLPVKSIFRFKSVSKHWHSLITDPSFAYSYTNLTIEKKNYSNPWTLLFCYMNTCSGKTPPYSTGLYAAFELCNSCDSMKSSLGFSSPQLELIKQIPNLDCLKLLACHNGLLLCCASQQQQELYFVCNPLTLRWLAIPRRPQLHKWVSIGFMVQPEDGSFLLVRIAKFSGLSNVLELESFCSNEGKWFVNKLVCDSPVCLFFTHRQAVPFRGILHWREYNNRIISYDPVGKTGKCRLIDMPKGRDRDGQGVLQVSRSRMCYFEICMRCISSGFYVWVLENYELGEWFLHYRISLDQIQTSNSLLRRSVLSNRASLHPLTFHPLNPEVVYLMCGDRLALFDFKDGRLKIESEDRFSQSSLDSWTVVPFVLPPWPTPMPKPSWSSRSC